MAVMLSEPLYGSVPSKGGRDYLNIEAASLATIAYLYPDNTIGHGGCLHNSTFSY